MHIVEIIDFSLPLALALAITICCSVANVAFGYACSSHPGIR